MQLTPNAFHSFSRREVLRRLGALGCVAGSLSALLIPDATRAAGAQTRVRIGQVGVAHAHANKLSIYRASPDYEVVGVVEPDAGLKAKWEKDPAYRGLPWMTQEELLSVPGLSAVMVETRVKDLLATAEACLLAGKHVHIDKPAGDSLPHLRRVLSLAKSRGLMVQMGYMYRYNPGFLLLKKFLREGWLGEIFEVHAVMSKVVEDDNRKEFALFPGGIQFELGCHVLDLVIGILGKPERVNAFNQRSGKQEDGLKDNMLAVLEYPRSIATLKSSALEVEGFARRHLVVCGSQGTFQIQPLDNPKVTIALDRDRGEFKKGVQEVPLPRYRRYVGDAEDMVKVIRGQKQFEYSYEHDLLVQETLLRACGMPFER